MNPTENLQRIIEGKNNLITSITNKGVIVPENTLIDDLYQYVDDIQTGGSGDNWFSKLSFGKFPEVITPNMFDQADGTQLRNYAFLGATSKNIILPNWITKIGDYCFSGCTAESINIPNSLTTLGTSAFQNCTNLKEIDFSNIPLKDFPGYVFSGCTALEKIVYPSTITAITSSYVFAGCSNLTVELPDTVTKIGSYLVQGCKKVILPSSLTYANISSSAFYSGTYSPIPELVIRSNILSGTSTTSNFMRDKVASSTSSRNVIKIVTKDNCTEVGNYALYSGTSTTTIELGDEIRTIGISAAQSCTKLETLKIGSGCTSIGNNAFSGCTALTSISITAPQPPTLGSNVFAGSTCPIYVPAGSLSVYLSAWSTYASRIQPMAIDNTILYTVADGNIVPVNPNGFKDVDGNALSIVENALYAPNKGYILLSGDVHEFDGSFAYCSKLTDISIPSTLEKIGDFSFDGTQLGVLDFTNNSLPELTEDALTNSNVKINVSPVDYKAHYGEFDYSKVTCVPPDDEVWYLNEDGKAANLYTYTSYWGNRTILSNTYEKFGRVKLNGTITYLYYTFSQKNQNAKDIFLPNSVTSFQAGAFHTTDSSINNVFANNVSNNNTQIVGGVMAHYPNIVLWNTRTNFPYNSYNNGCNFYVPADTVDLWKEVGYENVYPLEDFKFE